MKLTESDQKLLKELCSEYNINYFKVITLLNKVKEYELKDRRSGIYEALKNIIKSDFLMDTA
ncbi:MAG: hypothetical protein H7A23_03575 [Leptospiraceae bacterium]|nr:hypothetical protein [Leptospiraceae bacterium]MCP5493610.1 hypothetical protein [Leptospiraceae bacterium]